MSRVGLTGPSERKCSLRVVRHSVAGRALLLARYDDFDAPVFLAAALGAVIRNRVRGAKTNGFHSCGIDAAREESIAYSGGAPLRKFLVRCCVTGRIRVTFNTNRTLGIDAEQLCQ